MLKAAKIDANSTNIIMIARLWFGTFACTDGWSFCGVEVRLGRGVGGSHSVIFTALKIVPFMVTRKCPCATKSSRISGILLDFSHLIENTTLIDPHWIASTSISELSMAISLLIVAKKAVLKALCSLAPGQVPSKRIRKVSLWSSGNTTEDVVITLCTFEGVIIELWDTNKLSEELFTWRVNFDWMK